MVYRMSPVANCDCEGYSVSTYNAKSRPSRCGFFDSIGRLFFVPWQIHLFGQSELENESEEKSDDGLGSITSLMAVRTLSSMVTSANSGTQLTKIPSFLR